MVKLLLFFRCTCLCYFNSSNGNRTP